MKWLFVLGLLYCMCCDTYMKSSAPERFRCSGLGVWQNNIPTLQEVKSWLGKCFAMKDLREAAYILGIRIVRNREKRLIGLSQDTYLDKVLKRFSMENSKKGELPVKKQYQAE